MGRRPLAASAPALPGQRPPAPAPAGWCPVPALCAGGTLVRGSASPHLLVFQPHDAQFGPSIARWKQRCHLGLAPFLGIRIGGGPQGRKTGENKIEVPSQKVIQRVTRGRQGPHRSRARLAARARLSASLLPELRAGAAAGTHASHATGGKQQEHAPRPVHSWGFCWFVHLQGHFLEVILSDSTGGLGSAAGLAPWSEGGRCSGGTRDGCGGSARSVPCRRPPGR